MSAVLVQRRLLGAVLALLIAASGLLLVVEASYRLLDRGAFAVVDYPVAVDEMAARSWSDGWVRSIAVVVLLLGLAVLVSALRRQPRPLAMRAPDGLRAEMPPKGVARVLEIAAGRVSGVRAAEARVSSRTARITATTRLRDPGDLEERVASACSARLDALMLERPPRQRVTVRRDER